MLASGPQYPPYTLRTTVLAQQRMCVCVCVCVTNRCLDHEEAALLQPLNGIRRVPVDQETTSLLKAPMDSIQETLHELAEVARYELLS